MAGRPAAAGTSPPDRDRAAPNVVAWISQWADDHLRLVRVPQTRRSGRWWARAARLSLRETRPGEARAADPPGRGGMEGRGGAARGPPGQGSVCGAAGAVGKGRAETKAGHVTP